LSEQVGYDSYVAGAGWIRLFLQIPVRHDMDGPDSHGWMFDGMGGMLFGGLWMILVWLVPLLMIIVLLNFLLGKHFGKGELEAGPEQKTPLDILKEAYAYARGEIGRDE
jgi:putative membrane protein